MKKRAISDKQSISDRNRNISLSYSQALRALREIGLAHGSSPKKFAYYVKSLRRLGIPFKWNHASTRGKSVKYHFESIMELAIALSLRVYGTLPDAIPQALRTHRKRLYEIYREAGLGPESKLWTTASIEGSKGEISGVFLELGLAFEDGRCVEAGAPAALNSRQAIERFALSSASDRSWLPLNISKLATELVEAAGRAPPVRSTASPISKGMFRPGTFIERVNTLTAENAELKRRLARLEANLGEPPKPPSNSSLPAKPTARSVGRSVKHAERQAPQGSEPRAASPSHRHARRAHPALPPLRE